MLHFVCILVECKNSGLRCFRRTNQYNIKKMPPYIPPQASFFYKGKWTPKLDSMLLTTIVSIRRSRSWEGNEVPTWVLVEVERVFMGEPGAHMTARDLSLRLKVLEHRYATFKEVVATEGATWVQSEKVVIAAEDVWKKILKDNPFAGAYYHHDNPDFHMLASVFGMDDVKTEFVTEVIIISDTTEVVEHANDKSPADRMRSIHLLCMVLHVLVVNYLPKT